MSSSSETIVVSKAKLKEIAEGLRKVKNELERLST